MPEIEIAIHRPDDEMSTRALDAMCAQAMRTKILLFGGDRWRPVEFVAVAQTATGFPVGLASLSPTDEMGEGGPQIIGVWVTPFYRKRGIGTRLVLVLAAESRRRYDVLPTCVCVTQAGHRAALAAQRQEPQLVVVAELTELELP